MKNDCETSAIVSFVALMSAYRCVNASGTKTKWVSSERRSPDTTSRSLKRASAIERSVRSYTLVWSTRPPGSRSSEDSMSAYGARSTAQSSLAPSARARASSAPRFAEPGSSSARRNRNPYGSPPGEKRTSTSSTSPSAKRRTLHWYGW